MLQDTWNGVRWALGVDVETKQLAVGQMALRALVIFVVGLVMVRLGDKRFLGRSTAFDALLAIILGSVPGDQRFGPLFSIPCRQLCARRPALDLRCHRLSFRSLR